MAIQHIRQAELTLGTRRAIRDPLRFPGFTDTVMRYNQYRLYLPYKISTVYVGKKITQN